MDHLILALPAPTPYLDLAFHDGSTPREHLWRRIRSLLDEETPITIVLPPESTDYTVPGELEGRCCTIHLPNREGETSSGSTGLARVLDSVAENAEHILWIDADAPFLSVELTRYLFQLHRRSWCDYTFGDGFPTGYAPQFIRRDVFPALITLAESRNLPWTRFLLFDALSVDINAFDIETEAAMEDYSLLRVSLTADTRANYLLCRRLVEQGVDRPKPDAPVPDPFNERYRDDSDPLLQVLLKEPVLRRTVPRYYQIQITERITQEPSYTVPVSEETDDPPREMSPELFTRMIEQIATHSPEATLALGYRGEPGTCSRLEHYRDVLSRDRNLTIYLETSGVGWTEENLVTLETWDTINAIIVELDAFSPETYRSLRGNGMDEALQFIERMRHAHPGKVYVQATRMVENEWDLQSFHNHWKNTDGTSPLIQKYNNVAGRLPDRRVADLEPLVRVPCRHLERDMVILVDGRVPRCFQDLDVNTLRGSLQTDDLATIWERGDPDYRAHLAGTYPDLCRKCDEYYTINA